LWSFSQLIQSSNLKNFFLGSAKGRELKQMVAIYERVKAKFDASPFRSTDAGADFIESIVQEACELAEVVPCDPLARALQVSAIDLMLEDGALWEFPEVASLEALTLEEGVALRTLLSRKERFLAEHERLLPLWRHKIAAILAGVMGYLPVSCFSDEEDGNGAPPLFTAPLVDLCEEPATAVERTIITMADEDVVNARIFEPIIQRLERNLLLASGIPLEQRYSSTKSLVMPGQAKVRDNVDLIEKYVVGTGFQTLFASRLPFAIPFPARFEHMHVVGGSGHGKTQLLQLMIHHDLTRAAEDGRSVVVIDSQGDLIRTISHLERFAPDAAESLADRLMLIDPTDIEYPVCLNMFDWKRERLANFSPLDREKLLNSAIDLYEYLFGALLGAELTQRQGVIFKYIARLMLEIPGATIQTLRQLMEDGEPFRPYMEKLPGSARSFFATRFFDRTFSETKKQVLTRLWGVLSNATLERMFSHEKNKVDLYAAINSGKIILINTAKDLLKEEGCAIFGRFFIALIAQAVQQRAALQPHERTPCFVYIDEAQDYFDDNVEHLLNQARKYRVGMVMAHQNLDQLAAGFRSSVLASTSIKFAGGVSAKDARVFADEMRSEPEFIQGMRKRPKRTEFACYVKNLTPQAIAVSVPLGQVEAERTIAADAYKELIALNRTAYSATIEEAERQIAAQHESVPDPNTERRAKSAPREKTADAEPPLPPAAQQAAAAAHKAPGPTTSDAVTSPRALSPENNRNPTVRVTRANTPAPLGRGGRQHQYLQHLVKELAEQRGYRAVIEEPILDGAGKVDVSLTRGKERVACEISVTTSRDQELMNVEKCLSAGFDRVIVIAHDERHLKTISRFIAAHVEESMRDRLTFLLPDGLTEHLQSSEQAADSEETTVRGYRVKVTRSGTNAAEASARREAIAKVIGRSLLQQQRDSE
jgi:hypothetical protein